MKKAITIWLEETDFQTLKGQSDELFLRRGVYARSLLVRAMQGRIPITSSSIDEPGDEMERGVASASNSIIIGIFRPIVCKDGSKREILRQVCKELGYYNVIDIMFALKRVRFKSGNHLGRRHLTFKQVAKIISTSSWSEILLHGGKHRKTIYSFREMPEVRR